MRSKEEELQAITDEMTRHFTVAYEKGVKAGHMAALDNLDALIEKKRNSRDVEAVEILNWVKENLQWR